jgi:GT2 family glycosyltransferase
VSAAALDLTVVVPTYDRAAVLARCLDALDGQVVDAGVQTIVVDDGSTDGTEELLRSRTGVEVVRIAHAGRSAARNAALERATGDVIVFVDDDVLASDGLLQRHLDHHRRHASANEALVGLVTWAPELAVTPHMEWLERGGPLFAFDAIDDPDDVDWRHFCTANASVKRAFLAGERFDESLERAVDVELGYRLSRRGMRLRYDPEAVGHHLRADTPRSTERRMRSVGRAMRLVHQKHPELREPPARFGRLTPLKAAAACVLRPLVRRPELDEKLFSYRGARAFAKGYAEGDRRPPRRGRLDRFDALMLAAFAAMSVAVLAALATRPLTMTGADGGVIADQLQYFAWIRSAAEHGVIRNMFDVNPPGTSYFVHPGFLLSGLLHRAGLGIAASYQLLWKPVAIVALFFAFRAYLRRTIPGLWRRRAALALALFYVSPFTMIVSVPSHIGLGPVPQRLKGQLDFMSGEMFPGLYMWGYMMTALAVALVPVVLLAIERARVPERRAAGRGGAWYAGWAAAAGLLMAWLQPWEAVPTLATVAAVELIGWRRAGRADLRGAARALAPLFVAAAIPLAYYWWMAKVDPSWAIADRANRERVGNWPWYAWALGLLPIAVPAALGYRLPARDWQALAVRVLPLAMIAEYWLISATGAGTFPFHSIQGLSLPLAVLAVTGVAAREWRGRLRSPAAVWGAVLLLTLPGVAHKLNAIRMQVHRGGEPYFLHPGEEAAFRFLERSPVPGAVMAPIYSGLAVPYQTGRESWVGEVSWTPHFDRRRAQAGALFSGRLTRPQAVALVRSARVRFLFADCEGRANLEPLLRGQLEAVRRFGCATVYQLRKPA